MMMKSTDRKLGKVKFFNSQKGYGFIVPNDMDMDVFVHHTNIKGEENKFRSLAEGEEVEFDLVQGSKGYYSTNVTGLNGSPVRGDPKIRHRRNGKQSGFNMAKGYSMAYAAYGIPRHGAFFAYAPFATHPPYLTAAPTLSTAAAVAAAAAASIGHYQTPPYHPSPLPHLPHHPHHSHLPGSLSAGMGGGGSGSGSNSGGSSSSSTPTSGLIHPSTMNLSGALMYPRYSYLPDPLHPVYLPDHSPRRLEHHINL